MTRIVEKNVAELIMVAIFSIILLSSCGTTAPHHACGITELNKQYSRGCK